MAIISIQKLENLLITPAPEKMRRAFWRRSQADETLVKVGVNPDFYTIYPDLQLPRALGPGAHHGLEINGA